MSRRFIALFLLLAVIAVDAKADTKLKCNSIGRNSAYLINPTAGYDHDRYGTLPIDVRLQFGAFVSSFDGKDDDDGDGKSDLLAVPHWVAYELRRYGEENATKYNSAKPSPGRPRPWYELPQLSFLSDPTDVQYADIDRSYTGYGAGAGHPLLNGHTVDRGHMAAKVHAQRIGWKQACNTHVFANAIPQQSEMNQGDWLVLESYTGALANKYGVVWIVAGPVWKEDGKPLGFMEKPKSPPVAMPAGSFKLVIKENKNSNFPDVLAFIFEQPRDEYKKCKLNGDPNAVDLTRYQVTISDIEKRTGLTFLSNVDFTEGKRITADERRAKIHAFKSAPPPALWPVELKYYAVKCGK